MRSISVIHLACLGSDLPVPLHGDDMTLIMEINFQVGMALYIA